MGSATRALCPAGAALAFLQASLEALDTDLISLGSRLVVRSAEATTGEEADESSAVDQLAYGAAAELLRRIDEEDRPAAAAEAADTAAEICRLVREVGASRVLWSRCYEPEGRLVETVVSEALRELLPLGGAEGFAGHLLYEPGAITMPAGFSGGHWGTLMPFVRACERSGPPPQPPRAAPERLLPPAKPPRSQSVSSLCLAPVPRRRDGTPGRDWAAAMMAHWPAVGETAAHAAMDEFVHKIGGGLAAYESRRSRADEPGAVSRLSPFLRFGQLSARQLYHAVRRSGYDREVTKTFARRLHWRDLAYYQLHAFPDMAHFPIRRHYAAHAWSNETPSHLRAWQLGRTGYPMVDAAMRSLYATGWMHQSLRMVCASFLVEYLGVSWVFGANWFSDTLVDADLAINSMMWQNAGRSGIDQWNFVLSPVTGSQDPSGGFCRAWLPELAKPPTNDLHAPWQAPADVLAKAGVRLGHDYPERILADLPAAREKTVAALLRMRSESLEFNDAGGYDLIRVPGGQMTRVFTKQEFRIDARGRPKDPAPTAKEGSGSRGRGGGKAGRGRGRARGANPWTIARAGGARDFNASEHTVCDVTQHAISAGPTGLEKVSHSQHDASRCV